MITTNTGKRKKINQKFKKRNSKKASTSATANGQ